MECAYINPIPLFSVVSFYVRDSISYYKKPVAITIWIEFGDHSDMHRLANAEMS